MNKTLFCIVGKSGSGKTTLVNKLEKEMGLKSVQSYTTRPCRYEGEVGHTFITDEEFDKLENIVSYTEFDGNRYAVTKDMLDKADLFVVDVAGVQELKRLYTEREIIVIFLHATDFILLGRMISRGDSPADARRRIEHDKEAFKDVIQYVNYSVDADQLFPLMFTDVLMIIKHFQKPEV